MEKKLHAGFARVDISPRKASVPLGGLGASEYRLSSIIQDPLNANVIALANGEERCLYISMELLWVPTRYVAAYRAAITEATGLPAERMFMCAIHTHSGPDPDSNLPTALQYFQVELKENLVEAAKRALADLKPAKLSYGVADGGRPGAWLNFDRHYYCVPIEKKDNYTEEDLLPGEGELKSKYRKGDGYVAVRHVEEVDHRVQVLRFTRDAADDIMILNFAAHPCFVDGTTRPVVSSDYPGALIKRMEELFPATKCSFLNSCAGNVVSGTLIKEEGIWGITYATKNPPGIKLRSHYAYAAALAGCAYEAIALNGKESETDTLAFGHEMYIGKVDHSKDHLAPQAKEALKLFEQEGHTPAAKEWCHKFGLGSVYACGAILQRAALPQTDEIELNVIRIGDCAIATLPFDTFSSIGEYVKAHSPFAMTCMNAYSCGCHNYLPNKDAHPECYEATRMRYEVGTGELLAEELSNMLKKLK